MVIIRKRLIRLEMQMDWLDRARKVRDGEELDSVNLEAFMKNHVEGFAGPLSIEQFPGGYSNLTYLLRSGDGHEYVLRRPPFGRKIKTAHDMNREYRILAPLVKVYPKVPRPLAYSDDESIIGAPFYVMERVKGVILRSKKPPEMQLSAELMRRLSEAFIDNLAEIHAIDLEAAGLSNLGKPAGYVRRQIAGWTKRYQDARTDDIPEIEQAAAWLIERMPGESGASLIHNDYKYNNLVLDAHDWATIIAVLDWEMATIGDPLMDLGTTLAYWFDPDDPPEMLMLQEQFGAFTTLPGNLSRRDLVERYAQKSERDADMIVYYYVYALFKVAVIAQQIYQRYKMGFSKDERFARMIFGVQLMGKVAMLAIEKGRIDRLQG
jgi:aminoglycoside phosphotransferase (APT) family kinase protein